MIDTYTPHRQRWIRKQRMSRIYDWFRIALILVAGVWLIAGNIAEVASK